MSIETIKIEIKSNGEDIAAMMDRAPASLGKAVAAGMDDGNKYAMATIQRDHLRQKGGLTSVGVVSDRLYKSVVATPPTVISGLNVRSGIGSNAVSKSGVSYPRVHEFGFSGTVDVPAFTRKNKANDLFTGGRRGGRKRGKGKKLVAGISVVRSHSVKMNFRERAMFRTGINESVPTYLEEISKAVSAAWAGGLT